MSYEKKIVIDFDDTISFTTNRDWKNATPVQSVIDKINSLYDMGWEILIFTARGQLSCKGNADLAEKKYGIQIRSWLKTHGVNYHDLSFQKPLGTYYVDDKALRPVEFVDLDIEDLRGGSGATIIRQGDRVYKTEDNALNTATWYKIAGAFFDVPKLHSVIGDTICIEYVEPDLSMGLPFKKMDNILEIFDIFSSLPPIEESVSWSMYVDRLDNHIQLNPFIIEDSVYDEVKSVIKNLSGSSLYVSFCHGDFSLDNILLRENGSSCLIDPIYKPKEVPQSWLLDVSKFLHSLRRYDYKYLYEYVLHTFSHYETILLSLEISHWIRIYKYLPEGSFERTNVISQIAKIGERMMQ